jgi:hypothetical protein
MRSADGPGCKLAPDKFLHESCVPTSPAAPSHLQTLAISDSKRYTTNTAATSVLLEITDAPENFLWIT